MKRQFFLLCIVLSSSPVFAQEIKNLVFEGAGIKGLAYAGAIQELEERGILKDVEKFELYQQAKVNEYWIVHPIELTILVNILNENGQYVTSRPYASNDPLGSPLLKDIKIELLNKYSGVSEEEGVYDHAIIRI